MTYTIKRADSWYLSIGGKILHSLYREHYQSPLNKVIGAFRYSQGDGYFTKIEQVERINIGDNRLNVSL